MLKLIGSDWVYEREVRSTEVENTIDVTTWDGNDDGGAGSEGSYWNLWLSLGSFFGSLN